MKKLILLFASLCIMLNLSAGTALGIKGGLQSSRIYETLSDASNPPSASYDAVLRTNLGLVFNFAYQKPVSFQMELNYSRKGSKIVSAINNKLTFGYIELPLLLKVSGGSEKFKFFGIAGPYVATALKAERILGDIKTTNNVFESTSTTFTEANKSAILETLDLGFHLGGGVTYKLGPGRVLAEIRYCQGFGDTLFGNTVNTYNTNAFQFNIGYLFTFGEE